PKQLEMTKPDTNTKKNSASTIYTFTGSWKDNSTVVKKLTSKMSPAKGGSLLECSEKQCRK
ncbi:MAG: hypothetical protein ACK559_07165, partial [bacterium]